MAELDWQVLVLISWLRRLLDFIYRRADACPTNRRDTHVEIIGHKYGPIHVGCRFVRELKQTIGSVRWRSMPCDWVDCVI